MREYEIEEFDEPEFLIDERPRSRVILQELAGARIQEQDSFEHVKKRVSGPAVKGLLVLVCAVLLSAVFLQFLQRNTQNSPDPEQVQVSASATDNGTQPVAVSSAVASIQPTKIFVHVAGAVKAPGVYEMDATQRIVDAIEKAGGATDQADLNSLNLAQMLTDGQQIYVAVQGETHPQAVQQSAGTKSVAQGTNSLININTASASELEKLPRVGPATATKIVEYRESHGKFSSVDDLLSIPGIGQKTIESFEGLVTF